jgi:crotonobetainyl-CoA:carnitine CoA-transferase CaiB-like acyl-CoA transferase
MKEKPFAEWAAIFEEQDIPHAPSQWTEDLLGDPQVIHEDLIVHVDDPVVGPMDQMGKAVVFEDAPAPDPPPAPRAGAHTDAVLSSLGFAPAEIERLRASGAVS